MLRTPKQLIIIWKLLAMTTWRNRPLCHSLSLYKVSFPLLKLNYDFLGCYQNCFSCTDIVFNKCLSCKSGFKYYSNTCFTSCPDGTYQDDLSNNCFKCPSECATCQAPDVNDIEQCFTCNDGYYQYQTQCLSVCPIGTYADTNSKTCKGKIYSFT
jgi:hypothetical protein